MENDLGAYTFSTTEVVTLSDVIYAGYGDLFDEALWHAILDRIRLLVPWQAAGVVLHNTAIGEPDIKIIRGATADFYSRYPQHDAEKAMLTRAALARGLTVWRPTDLVADQEWQRSEMRMDFLRDLGLDRSVCVMCGAAPDLLARIWLIRKEGEPDFTERQIFILHTLTPHFAKALTFGRELRRALASQTAFQRVMRPAVICDPSGTILEMNDRARQLCEDGRVKHLNPALQIEAIAHRMITANEACICTQLLGKPHLFMMAPVDSSAGPRRHVVAFEPTDYLDGVLRESMRRHGLSAREIEVCMMVARGISNHEIGEKLFIAETTVKDHVASIFEKLGVEHRSAIVPRLLEF